MTRASKSLFVAALAGAWLSAAVALAGQPVTLRTDISAAGPITLGDLFDGAGPVGKAVVGTAAPVGLNAVLDAGEVQRLAHVHGLDWDNPRGVRRIIVLSVAAAATPGVADSQAPAKRMVEALTFARSLNAGELVQAQDLTFAKVAAFQVPPDAPDDAARVIGKVSRRPLRAGSPVSSRDVTAAQVIKRDDVVEIAYHNDGVNLVLQGRAMSSASAGEPVTVMNTTSKKAFQAIAVGPDQAVVGPEAERMRTALINPDQFASR
ncbi:MAG TPA: flagellar basal body P-ring formation chaperone FlgA [Caulobacteraceae bacterium]|jgi:flagella basal body P-ring formation protein FlgA|nr:flagellar basal body P-ring formation chaperone FlgA [Caulobacteraceae bacterium]